MKISVFSLLTATGLVYGCQQYDSDAAVLRVDTIPPVISLRGDRNDTVSLYTSYNDPGAEIMETVDERRDKLRAQVTGTVDSAKPGDYYLYYNAKDTVTRTVHVMENSAAFLSNAAGNLSASKKSFTLETIACRYYPAVKYHCKNSYTKP